MTNSSTNFRTEMLFIMWSYSLWQHIKVDLVILWSSHFSGLVPGLPVWLDRFWLRLWSRPWIHKVTRMWTNSFLLQHLLINTNMTKYIIPMWAGFATSFPGFFPSLIPAGCGGRAAAPQHLPLVHPCIIIPMDRESSCQLLNDRYFDVYSRRKSSNVN